jgi:hypothetical protein
MELHIHKLQAGVHVRKWAGHGKPEKYSHWKGARIGCLYLLAYLALGPIAVQAQQAPGYLGKKALLTAEINAFPAFSFTQSESLPLSLNTRTGIVWDQVVSRSSSIGGGGGYYHSQMVYQSNNGAGMARINGYYASMNAKFYTFQRKGNIAPLGPYQQVELMYLRYRITDIDKNFYADRRSDLGTYGDFAAGLTFGLRHIMLDRLALHVGMQYAFVFGVFQNGDPQERLARRYAIDRLRGHFSLNYHAGIGILLF